MLWVLKSSIQYVLVFPFYLCMFAWVNSYRVLGGTNRGIIIVHSCYSVSASFLRERLPFSQWVSELLSGSSLKTAKVYASLLAVLPVASWSSTWMHFVLHIALSFLTVNVSYPWEVHVLLNISVALWGSSHPVSFVSLLITTIEFISLYLIKYQHLASTIYLFFLCVCVGGILSTPLPSGNQVLQHLFSSALV